MIRLPLTLVIALTLALVIYFQIKPFTYLQNCWSVAHALFF
jgi:hypothetical protein